MSFLPLSTSSVLGDSTSTITRGYWILSVWFLSLSSHVTVASGCTYLDADSLRRISELYTTQGVLRRAYVRIAVRLVAIREWSGLPPASILTSPSKYSYFAVLLVRSRVK